MDIIKFKIVIVFDCSWNKKGGYMRLTRKQMEKKYPNQWLGLKNVIYKNDDGVTIESAEIVYTDKSKEELLKMQISGVDGIIGWYTTEEGMMLGMAGVI